MLKKVEIWNEYNRQAKDYSLRRDEWLHHTPEEAKDEKNVERLKLPTNPKTKPSPTCKKSKPYEQMTSVFKLM